MRRLVLSVLFVGVVMSPARASALLDGDTLRIFAVGELGVAGSWEQYNTSSDLSLSFGAAAGLDYGLHDLLAIGVMGRLTSLKLADDVDAALVVATAMAGMGQVGASTMAAEDALLGNRSTLIDVSIYPRLRLPLPILEIYALTPIGYSNLSPSWGETESGWNFGLIGGVGLSLLPILKIVAQGGYTWHFMETSDISELGFSLGLSLGF